MVITILLGYLFIHSPVKAISDLGCEIVTGTDAYPKPAEFPKPGYLESYIDPYFGSKVTRITGDPGTPIVYSDGTIGGTWSTVARHEYSKQQVWNADQSVIWLQWTGIFLDGKTYIPIKYVKPSGTESRWHPTDANYIIYISYNSTTQINTLGKYNPNPSTRGIYPNEVIATFTGYPALYFGPGEGNLSRDGSMVVLYAVDAKKAFAYNLAQKIKYSDIDFSWNSAVDWVSISAEGKYVVANVYRDITYVYDLNGTQVGPAWSTFGCPSHYDLTIDNLGKEVGVGTCKSGESSSIIKRNLTDGQMTPLGYHTYSSHTSARNIRRPLFVYTSTPGYDPYKNEVLAIKQDGSVTERLAWIPNYWSDYATEPHAVPSPDGKKVIIASNWGSATARPVQTYLIETCPGATSASPSPSSEPTPFSSPAPGDADGNGIVDTADFMVWVNHYSETGDRSLGNFNSDPIINLIDFGVWLINFLN